jgi:hypothetical protein
LRRSPQLFTLNVPNGLLLLVHSADALSRMLQRLVRPAILSCHKMSRTGRKRPVSSNRKITERAGTVGIGRDWITLLMR